MNKAIAIRHKIIQAGEIAIEQLIRVAKEDIFKLNDVDNEDLSVDKLKNAAASKKLAIFDALEILNRIEAEREALNTLERGDNRADTKQGFAESRAK